MNNNLPQTKQTAIIIGAGPTGNLMAILLAQRGWQVKVYEKRENYQFFQSSLTRKSYNIILSPRGLKALEKAQVKLSESQIVILEGNVRHGLKTVKKSKAFTKNVSIKRNILAQSLYTEAQTKYAQEIEHYFSHELINIDFDQKIATLQNLDQEITTPFDLLIGADGVFSKVRAIMKEKISGFSYQQNCDNMMFKICQLGEAKNLINGQESWGKCFHVWYQTHPLTIAAPPDPDGTLTAVLIMPEKGEKTFNDLTTHEDIEHLFKSTFPDIFSNKTIPLEFSKYILDQKTSYGGFTTICSQFDVKNCAVLIGDAGHSIWASLGQGCNTALESCGVFADILDQHNQDITQALPEYTKIRKPQTDEIARLSEIGFSNNKRASNTLFIFKMILLSFLNKLLPFIFKKPALMMINNPEINFKDLGILQKKQDQQLLLIFLVFIISIFYFLSKLFMIPF